MSKPYMCVMLPLTSCSKIVYSAGVREQDTLDFFSSPRVLSVMLALMKNPLSAGDHLRVLTRLPSLPGWPLTAACANIAHRHNRDRTCRSSSTTRQQQQVSGVAWGNAALLQVPCAHSLCFRLLHFLTSETSDHSCCRHVST